MIVVAIVLLVLAVLGAPLFAVISGSALVGFSTGSGAADPGSIRLGSAVPFSTTITSKPARSSGPSSDRISSP